MNDFCFDSTQLSRAAKTWETSRCNEPMDERQQPRGHERIENMQDRINGDLVAMTLTRELHDACNAIFKAMKAASPELAAIAMARTGTPLVPGTPEHALYRDLMALSAVASSFATGDRPSKSDLKRVEAILAARLTA